MNLDDCVDCFVVVMNAEPETKKVAKYARVPVAGDYIEVPAGSSVDLCLVDRVILKLINPMQPLVYAHKV